MRNCTMLRVVILAFVCMTFFGGCSGGKGQVFGQVVDYDSGNGLKDVSIRGSLPNGGEVNIRTDSSGRFEIKGLTRGQCTLVFQKDGFEDQTEMFEMELEGVKQLKIEMRSERLLNLDRWLDATAEDLAKRLTDPSFPELRKLNGLSLAVVIHRTDPGGVLDRLSFLIGSLSNRLNATSYGLPVTVLNRDTEIQDRIMQELNTGQTDWYDPSSVAELGRFLGARQFLVVTLEEGTRYTRANVSVVSIQQNAYISGLSFHYKVRKNVLYGE